MNHAQTVSGRREKRTPFPDLAGHLSSPRLAPEIAFPDGPDLLLCRACAWAFSVLRMGFREELSARQTTGKVADAAPSESAEESLQQFTPLLRKASSGIGTGKGCDL